MSINIIKDDINELSKKLSELVISFLDKKYFKSFSNKRKISNSIHSVFVDFMESQCPLIKNKKMRKKQRKVYFPDDETLPTCEITSLTYKIKHEVTAEEYMEIIKYKNCYNNEDFLNAKKRRRKQRKITQRKRREKRLGHQRQIMLLNNRLKKMLLMRQFPRIY